jgi:hypothetical protein
MLGVQAISVTHSFFNFLFSKKKKKKEEGLVSMPPKSKKGQKQKGKALGNMTPGPAPQHTNTGNRVWDTAKVGTSIDRLLPPLSASVRASEHPCVKLEVRAYDLAKEAFQGTDFCASAVKVATAIVLREKSVPFGQFMIKFVEALEADPTPTHNFCCSVLRGFIFLHQRKLALAAIQFRKLFLEQRAEEESLVPNVKRSLVLTRMLSLEAGCYLFAGAMKDCVRVLRECLVAPGIEDHPWRACEANAQLAKVLARTDEHEALEFSKKAVELLREDEDDSATTLYLHAFLLCREVGIQHVPQARKSYALAQEREKMEIRVYGRSSAAGTDFKSQASMYLHNPSYELRGYIENLERMCEIYEHEGEDALEEALKGPNMTKVSGNPDAGKKLHRAWCYECGAERFASFCAYQFFFY